MLSSTFSLIRAQRYEKKLYLCRESVIFAQKIKDNSLFTALHNRKQTINA